MEKEKEKENNKEGTSTIYKERVDKYSKQLSLGVTGPYVIRRRQPKASTRRSLSQPAIILFLVQASWLILPPGNLLFSSSC